MTDRDIVNISECGKQLDYQLYCGLEDGHAGDCAEQAVVYRARLTKARRAEREYIIAALRSKAAYDLCVKAKGQRTISQLIADFVDGLPEEA
jgi:hypothetical protein